MLFHAWQSVSDNRGRLQRVIRQRFRPRLVKSGEEEAAPDCQEPSGNIEPYRIVGKLVSENQVGRNKKYRSEGQIQAILAKGKEQEPPGRLLKPPASILPKEACALRSRDC